MRKPFGSPINWMVALTVQFLVATLILGPLTAPAHTYAANANQTIEDNSETPTTISSFLPDIYETTLNPQSSNPGDDLTTQNDVKPASIENTSILSKRHSSILISSSSRDTNVHNFLGEISQKNASEPEDDNLVTTTGKDDSTGGVSVAQSEGVDDEPSESISSDKNESGDTFSPEDTSGSGGSAMNDGETIFPPEDEYELDTDESVGATTYESLLRPVPTTNPQTFAAQLRNKLAIGPDGATRSPSRIGTRGLSSKSELNAIPLPTSSNNGDSTNSANASAIIEDATIVGNVYSVSDNGNKSYVNNNSSNASVFQQTTRARPTSVINNTSTIAHNNRVLKRKKSPLTARNNHTGSSLSSIYGNPILTSTASSTNLDGADHAELPLGPQLSTSTESNNVLPSQDDTNGNSLSQANDPSSPAFTSGHNSTAPEASLAFSHHSTNASSSRAILGFGSLGSAHGKVKRPKPIIIRDHDETQYITNNNISENSATEPVSTGNQTGFNDTTTRPVPEVGGNQGTNALPTPTYKRRVKFTSRRMSSAQETVAPTTPLPVSVTAINSSRSVEATAMEAANFMPMFSIRPTITTNRYHPPPLISSKRIFQQEFGITRNSYHDSDPDDVELQATTEYYSVEHPTSYPDPIPLGVRSAPGAAPTSGETEDVGEELEKTSGGTIHQVNKLDENEQASSEKPEINSANADTQTNEDGKSSAVTVTVTHTVVQTTSQIAPTATTNETQVEDNHPKETGVKPDAEKHPNLLPTPALPTSIFVSSTSTTSFETGQGPIISHSVEDVQFSTSRYGLNSGGIQSSHHDTEENDENVHKNDKNTTPELPQPNQNPPTPVISATMIKSVYFTQVEHPHFSSSSYEYTTSSTYSYFYPDHDMHPDVSHDDDHHEDEHGHDSSEQTTPPVDYKSNPDSEYNTVASGTSGFSPSPTTPQFWDESGLKSVTTNLTKSSSSQVPITIDENAGVVTPTIDVDVYPPPDAGPDSKMSTIYTTGRPPTTLKANNGSQVGSTEDNEISEEERLKLQNGNTKTITTDAPGVTTTGKDKESSGLNKDIVNVTNPKGVNATDSGKDKTGSGNENEKNAQVPPGIKTPFGIGESFGIGSVHVPLMIQMELDLTQPVFCSHLTNFKAIIVTLYGNQNDVEKINPDQIVVFTKPSCNSSEDSSRNEHNVSVSTISPFITKRPDTGVTIAKGTFPLTSPPHFTDVDDDDHHKSEKDTIKKVDTIGNGSDTEEILRPKRASGDEPESRSKRSTKMTAATRNANISHDLKNISASSGGRNESQNLFSVFFYVNDKNGSYDQDLTAAFVKLWNNSSMTNSTQGNDGNNNSNEMFIKRVKKVGMITASQLVSSQDSSDQNSGIIIAITAASIVAVVLFVLGVGLLVMRHRQSQTKFAKRCTPVTLDDYSLDNISVYNSFRRKQRLRGSKRSYTNAAFDDANAPSRPVNASVIGSVLQDIVSLENEFRAIPNVSATLDDIPSGAETKNRYANVIPMPDTRVLLTFQDGVPNSDYINANVVRGLIGEQNKYIVTQGPLEDTIVDFWRMVWEQQIRVIIMLTDFAEGGIAKCAEYYPRSETIDCSQLHGDYQITLEKRDITDNCITSNLVLKDMERNLRRDVVHLWYHTWPEKGVPSTPKMTIDFLTRAKKFTKESSPIVVHCSPGTGRSGAIVACDIVMREYNSQKKVDIPRLVMKIRQDRAGAVQTKEQYVHIYQVLHSYALRVGGPPIESI